MKTPVLKRTKYYLWKLKKFTLKLLLNLSFYQAAWIFIIVFFFAVLVIWPMHDEEVVIKKRTIHEEMRILDPPTRDPRIEADRIIRTTSKPVIVWWTNDGTWLAEVHCSGTITCPVLHSGYETDRGAYLFQASRLNLNELPLPRRSDSVIWGLAIDQMQENIPVLTQEKILNLFNFSFTFSRYSDVPKPLAHVGSLDRIQSKAYFVQTSWKNFHITKSAIAPVLYIQNDCNTATESDEYVNELMKYIQIDSYGDCLNNKWFPDFKLDDHNLDNDNGRFLKFIARYKFTIAIENNICNDYTSEKLWRAIRVGSVPIYFGSPTVRDWLPNDKSAILIDEYPTPKHLSEHLYKLLANDSLYEEYLEHKTKGIITNPRLMLELKARPYQTDFKKALTRFQCFICEKLHKMNATTEVNIVNKKHYDCPKPITALTKDINPLNYVNWESLKRKADDIYDLTVKLGVQ